MFARLIPNVFSLAYWRDMWRDVRLVWRVARDPGVPLYLKAIPLLVVAYLLSPLDLIPGFIPILGQLDDIALLFLGMKAFTYLAPEDVVDRHRRALGFETK